MKKRSGAALLLVITATTSVFIMATLFLKIVYNNHVTANAVLQRTQAFYLAEAGLEKGKVQLTDNQNWYTDLPYYLVDNSNWLINQAAGQKTSLATGFFKLVRESGKSRLYSIGFKGKSRVVLKIDFVPLPLKILKWIEL